MSDSVNLLKLLDWLNFAGWPKPRLHAGSADFPTRLPVAHEWLIRDGESLDGSCLYRVTDPRSILVDA